MYFIYFFVWFGVSTLADHLFFEEVIDNHVIDREPLGKPFHGSIFYDLEFVSKWTVRKDINTANRFPVKGTIC